MSKSIRKLIIFTIPLLVAGFVVSVLYKWNYIQHVQHIPDEYGIPYINSGVDFNKNRIDDGKDILQGAKDYMGGNPKYEGLKEYQSGFPTSNVGTNGDVVARALEYAGYDLQSYMNQDIAKNPKVYENVAAGENIAFRNVEAQAIFFSRYGEYHSTDIYDKNEWQAGDIIFFEKKHCAIVADKVNENGVRFIIHHFWGYQGGWFQDILETGAWGKVIGHYRISERITTPKTDYNSTKTRVKE